MTKNARYRKHYLITLEGVSTNEFTPKVVKSMLDAMVVAVNHSYKQLNATIEDVS